MCGIAGIFHADPAQPIDPETLVAMAAIQSHRGPDGFGWKTMDGVGMSHARLSIIDLDEQRGRQPFASADDLWLLAQNGEFYDYKRIRADLTARGARFTTKSDSEIVLHLAPRIGLEATLPQLRGEFAFALYDREAQKLSLVRDRFGIKPLYYTVVGDMLVFGSELKVLFAHPDVPRRFDPAGLYHQLMQTIVPGSTAFSGVRQVAPGHVVEARRVDGRLVVNERRYWDIEFPEMGGHARLSDGDCIDVVREGLLEAVTLRLEADVPVGCYLSGGIDSCSILGLASAAQQAPVKAFTIGFDDAEYDETPIAREMAESAGADQDVLRLDATHLYDHFEETLWHTERTIYNTLAVAKLLMSRHVRDSGYKVVVTGEGSDELFAGYPAFRNDLFLHGLDHLPADERETWKADLHAQNALFKGAMLAETAIQAPALDARVGFTPACLQPWLAAGRFVPDLLHPDLASELKGYDPAAAIAEALDPAALAGRHPLDRAQYVWIKTMLEGQILTWGGDRVDMANSMEARPAFLDHPLAERAATLPPTVRIKGRTEKWVLREAMKGLLPRVLYEREKFAFMAPPAHTDPQKWKAMQRLAERHLSKSAVESAGLLSTAGIERLFALHDADDTTAATRNTLDAVFNHMIGVQVLYEKLIAADVPGQARARAKELGWAA
jgi:asparagine synthase (glutamine-hydrolysing)